MRRAARCRSPTCANTAADWVEPIEVGFHGRAVHEIPPNGQGIAALMALGMLQAVPYGDTEPGSAARMHLEIEAMQLSFADLYAHVGDPRHMQATPAQMLDRGYLRQRAKGDRPAPRRHPRRRVSRAAGGTVYLCTADADGRMVSLIQSNYKGFGSGLVVPGTGIALHNRGSGFVTTAGHPNEVAGGKRPLHSIIPAFMTLAAAGRRWRSA